VKRITNRALPIYRIAAPELLRDQRVNMRAPWDNIRPANPPAPNSATRDFYVRALRVLDEARIDYVVGGGYAISHYTGIQRNTKDLDLFIRPADRDRTLSTLAAAGYKTEFFYPFWISKALSGDAFIDILYSSGNGICVVDDDWMKHSEQIDVHGYRTRLVPPEEQIWSKAFVQDRDRYDGADIAPLILCRGRVRLGSHALAFPHTRARAAGAPDPVRIHLPRPRATAFRDPSSSGSTPRSPPSRLPPITSAAARAWPSEASASTCASGRFKDGRAQPYGPLTPDEIQQLPEP
jgi:hypothetical protein